MPLIVGLGIKALLWLQLYGCIIAVTAARTQSRLQVQDALVDDGLSYPSAWDFRLKPSVNDTSNLVFESVNSLLQHWPNTRYRNGHTLVAGTIPLGTLLYHGAYAHEIPKTPEWAAVDPEHSYLFCRSASEKEGCWHLTLITTRPLKILYFDGSSAAKMLDGPMDSQDLVVWGKVVPEWVFNEKQRILDLCAWGKKYEIDGYVRMEMDFEVMLCSFTEGVKTVSFLNLSPENTRGPPRPPAPRNTTDHEHLNLAPDGRSQAHDYRVVEAGSWHNRFPGDIRIQLDYTRLISFYDTASFPSLEPHRLNQERYFHRLDKIVAEDLVTLSHQLDEILGSQLSASSGIEWRTLFNVITNRYAERLEMLQYTLNTTSTAGGSSQDTVERAFRYVRSMLVTYIVHNVAPSNSPPRTSTSASDHTWARPVFEACATPYSFSDIFSEGDATSPPFSRSEKLLASSAKGVVREICRVLVDIWAEGVELGFQRKPSSMHKSLDIDADEITTRWFSAVSDLIRWLDWSYWVRCNPSCSHDETCYLPTWPYFGMPGRRSPTAAIRELDDEPAWVRPMPKCISRVEPFAL